MALITKDVSVSLSEIIEGNHESFLDLLEELVFADLEEEERYKHILQDIYFEVNGADQYGQIVIKVTGEDVII